MLTVTGTQTHVFSANGHTLTALPCTGTLQLVTDADGNPVSFEGITEHVPLPQGNVGRTVGRSHDRDWAPPSNRTVTPSQF